MSKYDIFLAHNRADKAAVEVLARHLREESKLNPFVDEWNLNPSGAWQVKLHRAIDQSGTCALFLGPQGVGSWENEEMRAYLHDRIQEDKDFRLILVLLPSATRPKRGQLPGFLSRLVWVTFRDNLDDSNAYRRLVSGIRGIVPGPDRTLFKRLTTPPYRGLEKFGSGDSEWFFGRNSETQQLVEELKKSRFLAVLGASGSGKSSVVLAGLVPDLQKGALPDSKKWPVLIFTPTERPLEELAVRLAELFPDQSLEYMTQMGQLLQDLESNENILHLTVSNALKNAPDTHRVLLVVDQFEEAFTLCQNAHIRQQFLANLLYASEIHGGRTVVVLTMRADFVAKCAEYPDLADRLSNFNFFVTPMVESQLRDAIERPAARAGVKLEDGLADLMLKEVRNQAGGLPLLEHALLELWKRRDKGKLTFNAYHEIGEVTGALAHTADATYHEFNDSQRKIAQHILLELVQLGEGSEDTRRRRRAKLSELVTDESEAEMVDVVLQRLANERLVTTTQERDTGEIVVNMAHETLIGNWPRLRGWIDENGENLRFDRRLREDAEEWEWLGHDRGALYGGVRLAPAEEWDQEDSNALNELELNFIQPSPQLVKRKKEKHERQREHKLKQARALAKEQQQRADERQLWLVGLSALLVVAVVAAVVAAFFAFSQAQEAEVARNRAEEEANRANASQLAAQAQGVLEQDPQRSLLLAVEALDEQADEPRVPAAEQALRDALANTGGIGLSGHSETIRAVAMNDHWVVSASDDKTIRVWNLDQLEHESRVSSDHESPIKAVAMTDQWLVTGSQDKTARVWDVSKNDAPEFKHELIGHTGAINAVAISPDNQWLVTASNDKNAFLWNLNKLEEDPIKLTGHTKSIKAVAISDLWVVTGSSDHDVGLFDLQQLKNQEKEVPLTLLKGHTAPVRAVAISDSWFASGSDDGTARLWNPLQPEKPQHILKDHSASINALAISEQWLVTGSDDRTARLWNLEVEEPTVNRLEGHMEAINAVAIRDQWVITGSDDHTARLWNIESSKRGDFIELKGHSDRITTVTINDDWVVTGSRDNTARLWNRKQLQANSTILESHSASISAVGISDHWLGIAGGNRNVNFWNRKDPQATPITIKSRSDSIEALVINNHWLVTANDNNGAFLWDLQQRKLDSIELKNYPTVIKERAISDRWLVTVSDHNTVRRWNLKKPADDPIELNTPSGPITHVAISDEWLVAASNDKIVRLWDPNRPENQFIELKGDSGVVDDMVINDHWLATSSNDKIARVWDLQQPKEQPIPLKEHKDRINAVAINEQWLVTASADKTARLWNLQNLESEPTLLLAHEKPVFSVAISPDNRWLVTGTSDHTAHLWDLQQPKVPPIVLRGHTGRIQAITISPDSHWLVTASSDKTVRLWNLRLGELKALACRTAGRNLSLEEWELYFSGQEYGESCPDLPAHYSVVESEQ